MVRKIKKLSYRIEQIKSLGLIDDYTNWTGHTLFCDLAEEDRMNLWNRGISEYPICLTCRKPLKYTGNLKTPFSIFCDNYCKNRNQNKIEKQVTKLKETESNKTDEQKLEKSKKISHARLNYTKEKKDSINQKVKSTNLDRYGVDNPSKNPEFIKKRIEKFKKSEFRENYRNTCVERYGVAHPWSNDVVREKYVATMIKEYGVDNPFKSGEIREKIKKTNLEIYGVEYSSQSDEVKDKIKKSNLEKYGVENYFQLDDFIEELRESKRNQTLKKYKMIDDRVLDYSRGKLKMQSTDGEIFYINTTLFLHRFRLGQEIDLIKNPVQIHNSIPANDFLQWLKSEYKGTIHINDRKILEGKEIDIYLPEKNLAIEFNGTYWHSDFFKSKDYHQKKKIECLKKEINLIHLWSDDWEFKRDIVKSIIRNKLGICKERVHARKCNISELSFLEYRDFCKNNHIQGSENSSIIRIGLHYKGELVSIMSFGKLRKVTNQKSIIGEYELIRMCNKIDFTINGGFSKMFSYFSSKYKPSKVTSYANLDYFDGKVYEKMDMKLVDITSPGYWWCLGKEGVKINRYNFTKSKLVKMGFDVKKTESNIMYEDLGAFRVWNSGSMLYSKNFDIEYI